MHFVYDFDGTLFSMRQLQDIWTEVLSAFDLEAEQIEAAGEKLFGQGYTPEKHVAALGIAEKEARKVLEKFYRIVEERSPELVFTEVVPWLDENDYGNKQTILTYGDQDFQTLKANASGLIEKVGDLRIAGPEKSKVEHLKELVENGEDGLVLIENNPHELQRAYDAGLPVTLIRMVRGGERHSDLPHPGDGNLWPCVGSLSEVAELV
jgi:hypothetical protein